jgi:hypothetical protein
MRYVRLYTDAEGESRFEDVALIGHTRGVQESELVARFSDPIPAVDVLLREVVKEASAERPHNAPRRQFIIQLVGECEVESSTGEVRRFGPGGILLVEDIDGNGHITRRVSDGERLTLLITLPDDPEAWPPIADIGPDGTTNG